MSGKKKVGGAGLRGQVAGQSAICTVGVSGSGLTYRGYDLQDLVENATFEEVAFLLLHGELPKQSELDAFIDRMVSLRHLPKSLRLTLENIPKNTHPMDVMRTGCSMLGNIEPEEDFSQQIDKAERMLAAFPAILNYWYNFSHKGVKIETELDDRSIGGYFLHTLHGKKPSELHATIMNTSLILYAEHEFNASTFAARVCASTLSDIHSSVTAAIGTLRGPLHGGANESAHAMISQWSDPDEAEAAVMGMLERKDLIMGFGHAVYTESDPRNVIIKGCSKQLSDSVGDKYMYKVSERVEEVMWREKKLFANADFYHASSYEFMGIPVKLFTPIFVCSRVIGWTAHIFEQRSNNRIIRPTSEYTGPDLRKVNPISER
ncbi:MAG: 2-methylcitrate synthase [Gammaproteobacteria bacterium]|jgi:2-methylcitrate synthase|nr:2-methylcitrate synthase [Gammaproteobacteria bacterium]